MFGSAEDDSNALFGALGEERGRPADFWCVHDDQGKVFERSSVDDFLLSFVDKLAILDRQESARTNGNRPLYHCSMVKRIFSFCD